MIPGGLYGGETTYFHVKDPQEGTRVRLQVDSGTLDVKGKVGRVPTQQSFQLLGLCQKKNAFVGRTKKNNTFAIV